MLQRFMTALILFCLAAVTAQAQSPTSTFESKYVSVYGAKIHYYDVGKGDPIVLVHGLADDTEVWAQVTPELAKTHRVIVLDQMGFGRSDKPMIPYRVNTWVDYLARFLEELKVPKATLVGNSLGGWVVAKYAIAYPERVNKLVLIGAAGYASTRKLLPVPPDHLRFSSRQSNREILPTAFHDPKFTGEEMLDFLMEQRVRNNDGFAIDQFVDSFKRGEDFVDGAITKVRAPTLVIWGRSDRLTPVSLGERYQREIRGAKLEVIERCGHMPQFECPTETNRLLTGFLRD